MSPRPGSANLTHKTNRESSIESLDRIHTFNLRNAVQPSAEVPKQKFDENEALIVKPKREEEQQDYTKKASLKSIEMVTGPKVSIGSRLPKTEEGVKESNSHVKYCDEDLTNIDNR